MGKLKRRHTNWFCWLFGHWKTYGPVELWADDYYRRVECRNCEYLHYDKQEYPNG